MIEIENPPLSLDLREFLHDVGRLLHAGFDVTAAFAPIPAMLDMIAPEHRRWSAEQGLLDTSFARPDVVSSLASLLIRRPTGPNASLLRTALRDPAMDFELPRISVDAIQPATRAVAFQALIAGKAS